MHAWGHLDSNANIYNQFLAQEKVTLSCIPYYFTFYDLYNY